MKVKKPEVLFEPASEIQESYIWNVKHESMFDGGVGNGKTTGGLMRLLILAREFPGSRWVVARETFKTLMNTTYKTFQKICPDAWVKRFVKENMEMANGSEILWLHLDEMSENDMKSLELNGAFVSQAEEIAPEKWEFLESRCGRWSKPEWKEPCPAYIWGECNPNGHDWIYFRFHPEIVGEHPDRAYFFGATSINQKMLDKFAPGYYERLMKKPESWKRRWVFGSREISEGSIHPEFRKEIHVYNADKWNPFERMDIKSCWGWFDYGLAAPTCLELTASSSNNFHFFTDEYYKQSSPTRTIKISDHAAAIQVIMRNHPHSVRGIYADPSIFKTDTRDRRTSVTSVAQEYRECGLYLQPADNNEITSVSNLQELLWVDPNLCNPITGKMGSPRLFVSSRNTRLIEQIQMQRHAETRNPLTGEKEYTEERAEGIPDHAYDPARYFANSQVWAPPKYRQQPNIPQYRTTPKTEAPVHGYMPPGGITRRNHDWRHLPAMPQVNRA